MHLHIPGRIRTLHDPNLAQRLGWRLTVRPLVAVGTGFAHLNMGWYRILGGKIESGGSELSELKAKLDTPDMLSHVIVVAVGIPLMTMAEGFLTLADWAALTCGGTVEKFD